MTTKIRSPDSQISRCYLLWKSDFADVIKLHLDLEVITWVSRMGSKVNLMYSVRNVPEDKAKAEQGLDRCL